MRICIVGKYPPIEGGTSAQTYWAARGLAERGHEVFVVTNADEVEHEYRLRLDERDGDDYEPVFPAGGGSVRVFRPERPGPRMSHIPMSNPFVSKLAGMAAQVVREYGCEALVAYYFEPYGVAAHLAASWTGVPMLVQHAGSDLDRLMRIPELAATYREMLRSADLVLTRPSLFARFLGMGVRDEALRMGAPAPVPTPVFHPSATPLTPAEIEETALVAPGRAFDPALPTIGMYGKPGEFKGTFDLVAALGALRREGARFNLLLMNGTARGDQVAAAIDAADLDDSTWVLPFLPHWRVPSFVRACTAVCFLERDFPIAIHGPMIPREILACGTCLVLSDEIYRKQFYRDRVSAGKDFVLVPDPKRREELAEAVRPLLENPELAREIGANGHSATVGMEDFAKAVDIWEMLLEDAVHSRLEGDFTALNAIEDPWPSNHADLLAAALPWARSVLGAALEPLSTEFTPHAPLSHPPAVAEEFCAFLLNRVERIAGAVGVPADRLRDVVRYQRARLWAQREDSFGNGRPPVVNDLAGRAPQEGLMRRLRPTRAPYVRTERFEYDVTPLLCHPSDGEPDATPELADLVRRPTYVCFVRLPNLDHCELRVNDGTRRLLALCDGRRTSADLADRLGGDENDVLAALRGLYQAGVVTFGDPAQSDRPQWNPVPPRAAGPGSPVRDLPVGAEGRR